MSAPEPSPQTGLKGGILAGRFTIERSLGAGGMGEVYLATDTKLRRRVAVKRVAARWRGDDQHSKQLMLEAERCSSLNHPNIAAIYDVLQDDSSGELAIVMEYIDGVTLRPSIGIPADWETFFRLALPCAEAMAAAHQQGIVHGDLKPENIMLARNKALAQQTFASAEPEVYADSGIIKVLDFGLATCVNAPPDRPTAALDAFRPGSRGTLGYVAPEVLRGYSPTPASDVFALGVIFYELLTGKHPFMAATNAVTLDRTLHYDAKLTTEQAGSAEAAQIINKMLAKDVAARYRNATEVVRDLQNVFNASEIAPAPTRKLRLLTYAALALIVGIGIGIAWRYSSRRSAISHYKLIAVLPFRPISSQPGLQALSDGLTETASAKLARIADAEGLQLVSPQDVANIHGTSEEALDKARRELGVDLAFVPSMEQSGDRVRINFRLVDTATRREIDGDSVVAQADDIFALEDHTVERMAALLDVKLRQEDRDELAQHGTENRKAYERYLEGVGYLRGYDEPKNIMSAVAGFQSALTFDPNYSLAYAGLGRAYWLQYDQSRDAALVEKARNACSKAVELGGKLAPPHVCLGTLDIGTGQYEDAAREFGLATSLDKTDDDAVRGLALAQQKLNRLAEAEATFKHAIELRPQYWAGYAWLGAFYRRQARYSDAAHQYELAAEHAPQNSRIFSVLGGIYVYQGDYRKAEEVLKRSIELAPNFGAYLNLGVLYLRERRFEAAIDAFETSQRLGSQDYRTWGDLADAYYWAAGKRELAVERYRKAASLAEDALKVNGRDYEAHLSAAHYYAAIEQRGPAEAHLKAAMDAQLQDQEVFYYAALVANQLGDSQRALSWLRAALAHGYSPAEIRRDVWFDNLRGNPDFQQLIAAH